MSNIQIADIITKECKQKNIKISELLSLCDINHSFISDMRHKNRAPSVDKISVIADYLGVSVDYLLGRTDTPTGYSGGINNVQSTVNSPQVSGNNNIIANRTETISAEDAELLELIKKLPLKKRVKFISSLYDELDE